MTSLLSLCQNAGALVTGSFTAERMLQAGKGLLVLLAEDASGNTIKKFTQKAFYYGVPCFQALSMERLGKAVGKDPRAVIVIADRGFAGAILELITS